MACLSIDVSQTRWWTVEDSQKQAENAVYVIVSHQIRLAFFNLLLLGISTPLREAARPCQLSKHRDKIGSVAAAFKFIERNDLAEGENALDATGYRPVK